MSLQGDIPFYRTPPAMPNRFGIYVHVPFCVHKCSYCDFYSFTKYQAEDYARWRQRMVEEVVEAKKWLSGKLPLGRVTSVFFGGGTPSLLPIPEIASAFEALQAHFEIDSDTEITVEANPETVTPEWCRGILDTTPVNRVSLGAQSFQPKYLAALERMATPESVRSAVKKLRDAGMKDLNLDLIFAIPGQTQAEAFADIDAALSLEPDHLSFYNLSLKPGHALYSELPSDDASADLYEAGVARLAENGFAQYEISNFSRPGRRSQHNLLYWTGGDYLGLGPSAASRFFWDGNFHHRKALSDFSKYVESSPYPGGEIESNAIADTRLEATFLELRLNDGIDLPSFTSRYGHDLTQSKNYSLFLREGLLERVGETLKLSPRGRLLADRVTRELVD